MERRYDIQLLGTYADEKRVTGASVPCFATSKLPGQNWNPNVWYFATWSGLSYSYG